MIKTQQRGVLKRTKILACAGELFALHGYESTTLAMVCGASGAAIGSIDHLIGHKPKVAAAVHEGVVADLTSVIERALAGHGYDLPGAVHALMTAYFAWAAANPHHQRILSVLTDYEVAHGPSQAKGLQARVEPLLLSWATPLIHAAKVRPFTATQLFALIMAPAMACTTDATILNDASPEKSAHWPATLALIVIQAITPPESQLVVARQSKPHRNVGMTPPLDPNDLFATTDTRAR